MYVCVTFPAPLSFAEVRNRGCLADCRLQLAVILSDFGEGTQTSVWHSWGSEVQEKGLVYTWKAVFIP